MELEYRSKSYMLFRTRANLWDLALDDYEGSLLNINIKTQYIYIYIYQITLQLFKRRLNVNTIPSEKIVNFVLISKLQTSVC